MAWWLGAAAHACGNEMEEARTSTWLALATLGGAGFVVTAALLGAAASWSWARARRSQPVP
jgi:hypothetical protein